MNTVLRISEAASLALHTMTILAERPGTYSSVKEIAEALEVSEHHLAKVLQRLTKAGIVHSVRGPKGGFVLEKEGANITLLEVFEAIEGPIDGTTCLLGFNECRRQSCFLGDLVEKVNGLFRAQLANSHLADFAANRNRISPTDAAKSDGARAETSPPDTKRHPRGCTPARKAGKVAKARHKTS